MRTMTDSYNSRKGFTDGRMANYFEAARIANYDPDYIRKLVRAEKIKARKWGHPGRFKETRYLNISKIRGIGNRRGPKELTTLNNMV